MSSIFSRPLRRWDPIRFAAAVIGIAWLAVLSAFAFGAISVQPGTESLIAAVALVAIAGAGFLYAWREPGS